MERIGILGGTFNPVHNGHINMASCFLERLNLDRVLFIPVWSPPHKSAMTLLPAPERLEMCRLACAFDKRLQTSTIEIERGGKSYTVDTLRELSRLMPQTRFYLITGADMFLTLEQWKGFTEISKLAALCACSRKIGELAALREKAKRLESLYGAECHVEDNPVTDVSSTQVRAVLSAGGDTSELLPPSVWDYIRKKGLYRTLY
jgi:nicotinate-nucleotide adenylyltransferase